jgi:DNA-binding transcriptional regulator GbsR (MarR family)
MNIFEETKHDEEYNLTPELKQSLKELVKQWDNWKGLSMTNPRCKQFVKYEIMQYLKWQL